MNPHRPTANQHRAAVNQHRAGQLLTDSPIYTTAEIVLGLLDGQIFERSVDPETGSRELTIRGVGAPGEG